jgi:uncharacterized membrane protein YkgB
MEAITMDTIAYVLIGLAIFILLVIIANIKIVPQSKGMLSSVWVPTVQLADGLHVKIP